MASINPNTAVLGIKFARHLLRRSTYVYTKALIDQYALLTPTQAVDLLFTEITPTIEKPFDPVVDGFWMDPGATNDATTQTRKSNIVAGWWWYNAINSANIKYKMCHFLSTRFTVEKTTFTNSLDFYDHIRLLMFYSFGNYKTLAKKITYDNFMLEYLNNTRNLKTTPNENYAREFLELFTIGKGPQIAAGNYTTYTEADIVQAAKVLTGIRRVSARNVIDIDTNIPSGNNNFTNHTTGSKTFGAAFNNQVINGATDNASMSTEFNTFVDMVFNKQDTAKNIVRKMYRYFVKSNISAEVETDIISPLATDLYNNGYNMVPVVKKLLSSLHFYDLDDTNANDEIIGGMIKSPLTQISEVCTYLQATIPNPAATTPTTSATDFYISFWQGFVHNTFMASANMIIFDPENVAGHPALYQAPNFDKNWISASTLISRYKLGESLLDGINRISGSSNIKAKINISLVIKNSDLVSVKDDPFILTQELCNALFGQEPSVARVNHFMNTYLLQGQGAYNWSTAWINYVANNNNSVVEPRLKLLLSNILRAPESQVF